MTKYQNVKQNWKEKFAKKHKVKKVKNKKQKEE